MTARKRRERYAQNIVNSQEKEETDGNLSENSKTKRFTFNDFYEGESTITVWCDGREYDPSIEGYRPVYSYSIVTPSWRYDDNDIHGAINEQPDLDLGSRSLFAFLLACAESESESSENYSLFPPNVREWAQSFSDELTTEYQIITE